MFASMFRIFPGITIKKWQEMIFNFKLKFYVSSLLSECHKSAYEEKWKIDHKACKPAMYAEKWEFISKCIKVQLLSICQSNH